MVNHLVYQGRLVDAPTCGQTTGGTDFANFRVAWSEKYKDKENRCFLECKAFGGTATFISKYFNEKGQELAVEGKLNTEEWEKDGQKRSKIVLVVDKVHFCGSKRDSGQEAPVQPNMTPMEVDEDQLPF